MEIEVGGFVLVTGTLEQIGKCVRRQGRQVEVEWFYSVVQRRREWYPASQVEGFIPPRQSRCYWQDAGTGQWETGRLFTVLNGTAYVAYREGARLPLPVEDVWVRCYTGTTNPVELMRARIWETPFFHSERAPLQHALIRQQEATHGLTALLSARIVLFDHQIQVIRRVLEDPVQRYLLADEVGLGKTIEAGVILRQLLIDKPDARALLLTPPALTPQWKKELATKLMIPLASPTMTFGDSSDLNTLPVKPYDMVIVDEAHHLARLAFDADRLVEWEKLVAVCHQGQRLLLLSATPALHHETSFLAMLHLLEPQTYSLSDIEGFRARIQNRDGVASALDMIQENMKRSREIRDAADALREYLPEDDFLMAQAAELEKAADAARAQGTTADVSALARQIRLHICETHRVHRRMLRSSRRRVPEGLLPQRVKGKLTPEFFTDSRPARTQYALDIWRETACLVEENPDAYQKLFALFLNLATTWPPLLRAALQCRQGKTNPSLALSPEICALLTETPLFDGEREQLEQWERDLADDPDEQDAIEDLLDVLKHHRTGRRVVFTAYTAVAEEIVSRLNTVMNGRYIYPHLATTPAAERYALLERFAVESASAVLVCDHTGEEGLNLQFVDRVIHFDLPWDVNRLEQRIGRLDRIGRTKESAPHHVFVPEEPENSFTDTFLHLVRKGVGVFQESVADLQFFLDRERERWVRKAFTEGAESLRGEADAIRAAIQEERILLRKQAALDETEAYETDDVSFAEKLREEDSDEQQQLFSAALSGWLINSLHLERTRVNHSYRYTESTLLPKERWEEIMGSIPPGQSLAYRRKEALDSVNCALLRPGNPFVDNLTRYMEWEDRGQSWALWRRLPETFFSVGERTYFRFDIITDADPACLIEATPDWNDLRCRPLLRQMLGWFPPRCRTIFIDAQTHAVVNDSHLLNLLRLEYRKSQDYPALGIRLHDTNLSRAERRSLLAEVMPDYDSDLETCLETAQKAILTEPAFVETVERSVRRTEKVQETRMNQLRRGLVYRGQNGDLQEEERIYRAMIDGIRKPRLRFDAIGLIVLSGRNPFAEETEGRDEIGGKVFLA